MWRAEWWDWFTQAVLVRISAVGVRWDADLFDVEPGCIWPPENVLVLVMTARGQGLWPAVYCNQLQHWAYVRQMFRMRGIEEPPYIVSNYDGVAVVPDGAVGKQYKHPPQIGKHYDLSVIRASWKPGRKGTDNMLNDEEITISKSDFAEIGVTDREPITFRADVYLKFANLYSSAAYTLSKTNAGRLDRVEDRVASLVQSVQMNNQLLAEILRRLDSGTPVVDVEAVARRAKELVGEDLLSDEKADSGE